MCRSDSDPRERPCDVAESCTGSDAACPTDAVATDGVDADACNGDEVCASGVCTAGSALDCDDGDACTADACDAASGCGVTLIDGCCNADLDCDDADACTEDTCSGAGGTCTNAPIADCGVDAGLDADGGTTPPEDGGCSCRAAGRRAGQGPHLWLAASLLMWVVRRRR